MGKPPSPKKILKPQAELKSQKAKKLLKKFVDHQKNIMPIICCNSFKFVVFRNGDGSEFIKVFMRGCCSRDENDWNHHATLDSNATYAALDVARREKNNF